MNRFDKAALVGAAFVTLVFVPGGRHLVQFYLDGAPSSRLATAIAGWVVATYGPLLVAACFWRLSKAVRKPWIVHVLVLPAALTILNFGTFLMLSTITDPDFDSTLGGPIMPATFMFLYAIGGYLFALIGTGRRS